MRGPPIIKNMKFLIPFSLAEYWQYCIKNLCRLCRYTLYTGIDSCPKEEFDVVLDSPDPGDAEVLDQDVGNVR